jgi:uncharacterized protein YggU (UPF0235/DUF167 family)
MPDGTLRAWVTEPALENRANEALVELIADAAGVPKSAVLVVRGHKSRTKTLRVENVPSGSTYSTIAGRQTASE